MTWFVRSLALLVLVFGSVAEAKADAPARYALSFAADAPDRFHVEADLPVAKDELEMQGRFLADPLPGGFADFIENLQARDAKGATVGLTHLGDGRWRLARPTGRVRLSYDVALKHNAVKWSVSGLFARGYAAREAVFFFGSVAFITGAPDGRAPAEITFSVPEGWQVATAWPEAKGRRGVYLARDWSQLTGTGSMVGRLAKRPVRVGELEVVFAAPRELESSIGLLAGAMEPIVAQYARDFGGAPRGKLAYFFNTGPSRGAETTDNTVSMMQSVPLNAVDKGVWSYILAHEIYHLWNGVAVLPQRTEEAEWFKEGFSVYGGMQGLYRSGLNTEAEFVADLARNWDRYRAAAGKVSMKDAGENKGANNYLIYNGGMAVAIAIDVEGRSRGAGGFNGMMRAAYARWGRGGGTYSYDDLVGLASQAAGTDMSDFFARYVAGTETVPLGEYLARAGLRMTVTDGKTAITRDPAASDAQKAMFPAAR